MQRLLHRTCTCSAPRHRRRWPAPGPRLSPAAPTRWSAIAQPPAFSACCPKSPPMWTSRWPAVTRAPPRDQTPPRQGTPAQRRHRHERPEGHDRSPGRSATSPPPSPPATPSRPSRRLSTARSSPIRALASRPRARAEHGGARPSIRALIKDPRLTRSERERRLLRLIEAAQLPKPLTNVPVHGYKVDVFWPSHGLVLEFDGWGAHGHRLAFESNRKRDQVLLAAGIRVLRVTDRQLDGRADRGRGADRPGAEPITTPVLLPCHASPTACVTGTLCSHSWWRWRSPPC